MPVSFMDQMNKSRLGGRGSSESSSFFSEELLFPTEKQVGFLKPESVPGHCGKEGIPLFSGSKSVSSSPLKKLHRTGGTAQNIEVSQPYLNGDLEAKLSLDRQVMGLDRMSNIFVAPWGTSKSVATCGSDLLNQPATSSLQGTHAELSRTKFVNGAFQNILSDVFHKKLILSSNNLGQSIDTLNSNFEEDEPFESMEEIEAQTIGNLLPDDDDLLSGGADDIGDNCRLASGVDFEDDIFYSGGGMELEADEINGISAFELIGGGFSNSLKGGLNGTYAGEHPSGERPSRTLFVRNVNSSVEDTELKALFEQYGDIRALYTACKHRGFVMISYYDIRSACNAMRALQNKPLRRRKLDIHFSIPKDNPSEKDINQGTLVLLDLDSSVSIEDLHRIFGLYGEIKEIRETPHKLHHKLIEFYDVRAADAALRALNRSTIAGKKIKLEPSRPEGARCLVQHSSSEIEQDELNGCKQRSPNSSPSGCFGTVPLGVITTNSFENGGSQSLQSVVRAPISPFTESTFRGISSSVPHNLSSPIRITSIGNLNNQAVSSDLSHSLGQNFGLQGMPSFHPHSLPEYNNGVANGISYTPSNSISAMGMNIRPAEGIDNMHLNKVNSNGLNNNSFDPNEGTIGLSKKGSCPVHGHQYAWNNTNAFKHHLPGPAVWSNSLPFTNTVSTRPPPQTHGIPRTLPHMMRTAMPSHHVGSAPTANPTLWDRRQIYNGDAAELPAFHPGSLGTIGFPGSPQFHQLEPASRNIFHCNGGNGMELSISPAHIGIPSPQQRYQIYHGRNHHMIAVPGSSESPNDRMRSRRNDAAANQTDNKKQYELDIERIVHGEDIRTTLMIKNIPNKYTSKMLLVAIDENHRGTYDFIYLPIDFKNKCNVGYAFINMTDPLHIVSFYQSINGKKWEKFNSEKVASLAYARIQGKGALIAHFQNSSLMNEDKRCRPILFHSEGPNAGDQEPFPMGINLRSRSGRSRTAGCCEEQHDESPPALANGEASCDISVSPGYTKNCE